MSFLLNYSINILNKVTRLQNESFEGEIKKKFQLDRIPGHFQNGVFIISLLTSIKNTKLHELFVIYLKKYIILNVFAAFVIRKLLLFLFKFIFEKTLQNAIGKFEDRIFKIFKFSP